MDETKDTLVIPPGPYCYIPLGTISPEGTMPIRRCPYWSLRKDKPYQENGYCSFLQLGDWEGPGIGHLWDQVKECGINDDTELI